MASTDTHPTKPALKKPATKKTASQPKKKSAREQAPDLTAAQWRSIANSTQDAEDVAKHYKLPDFKMVTRCRTWARRFGLLKDGD